MKSQADKSQENKGNVVANDFSLRQASTDAIFQFIDNRPEAINLRKLQATMDNHPQAQRVAQLTSIINSSPHIAAQRQHFNRLFVGVGQRVEAQTSEQHLNVSNIEAPVQLKSNAATAPIQRVPLDVAATGITHLVFLKEGSLYKKNFLENEAQEVQEGDFVEIETSSGLRSRRGPNQETATNNQLDEQGPSWYVWYLVMRLNGRPVPPNTYIREDTFRRTNRNDEYHMPIRSTVYGMTDLTEENLRLAYAQGYRDFDAAYMYHKGKTATLFKTLNIAAGPVRLIYKFKLKELEAAFQELKELASIKGVMIHTIMLHDMPPGGEAQINALEILQKLAAWFNAKIGLSNVIQEDIDSPDNFSNILRIAARLGIRVSSVQNRMSPSAPDTLVRRLCAEQGIDYMGFGLKGGGGHGGTCKMNADSAVENYPIDTDPLFRKMAAHFGLREEQLRHVMLDWARTQGVHAISQSRSSEGLGLMRSSFPPALLRFLQIYAHGHEFFPHHPDQASLYQPFELYLKELKIHPRLMEPLFKAIPLNLWRLFYKHTLAREHEASDFVKVMQNIDEGGITELLALNTQNGGVSSVTDLGNLFLEYKSGIRASVVQATVSLYPENQTDNQLHILGTSLTTQGQQRYLFDPVTISPAKLSDITAMNIDDTVQILIASDVVATYKKTGANQWQRQ